MFTAATIIFHHLLRALRTRARGERGAVSTEYGLILVLIVLVLVAALTAFGLTLADMFDGGASAVGDV
jgi:Flp pilus assembly pilin Flp